MLHVKQRRLPKTIKKVKKKKPELRWRWMVGYSIDVKTPSLVDIGTVTLPESETLKYWEKMISPSSIFLSATNQANPPR